MARSSSECLNIKYWFGQPYSLTYKDIVAAVERCSGRIQQLATDAAQAEQRVIHVKIEKLEKLMIGKAAINL